MENRKTWELFNTDFLNYTNEDGYNAYLEFCEINEIEPKGEQSSEFVDWACEEARVAFDCDLENLTSKADKEMYPFFIDGTLGLWNGNKEGHFTNIYWGLTSALNSIFNSSRSYDDFDAQLDTEAGVIYVNCHHHDGTNSFTIHLLSKRGLDKVQRDIDNYSINGYEYELKDYCFKKIRTKDIW